MNAESLALEAQLEIDAICQAFERAWQSGQQPRIEQYVSDAPEAIRERLREELAVAQAQLSTRRGAGSTDQADLTIPSDATINWTSSDVGGSALPPGYELLDELGRGGMGVVYKARQVGLDRLVALKMIRSGELASREEVERFNSEAQSAARLQHPYIVPVYEIGEHFGRPCFSMAFVGGMSLKDRVGDGPLNPRLAAELLLKTSQAVAYAHERGVVHRDLKPANILLNEAGDPCITDFGLAKRIDQGNDLTGAGQILGTPSYMPPEQALGQASQIGPLADVYALGATLYHLLTGRPPFQAASPIETIKQVIDTEPVPPRRLNDAVDRDLDTICMKCLEKQPARRYSSAHEIVQELTRYLNREPIQARRIGPMMRAMRWCRRKPLAATLAGVSSAAVIGGLLLVMRLFATQTLAESHRYFSEIGSARQAMEGGFPEWSRAALSHLEAAARIRPKSVDAAELRTAALQAWCAWDVRQLKKLSMPERVGAAAFSPDGGRLALAENLQSIKLRVGLYKTDFESPPDELNTYVFQDNLRVVFGNLKSVLDDLTAKRSPALRNRQTFRAAAFSGDGKFLVAGTRAGKIYMWSCGVPQMLDPDRSWQAHEGEIEQLCFSPDGKVIYSTAMLGESVKLWSPLGALLRELPGSHRYVAASPDGAWIATGGDTIQLFQAATLQAEPKWKVSGTSVAFSSDSKRLACGAADEETLQLVDVPSGRILRRFRDPTLINVSIANFLAFADHDRLLLSSCSDGRARVWDVFSGSLLTSAVVAGREFPDAAIHPDGRRVTVSGTSGTSLYEIVPAEVGHLAAVGEHPVLTIEFAPDTGLLAVAREQRRVDGLIRRSHLELWDVDANRVAFDTQVRELPKVTRSLFERVPNHVAFHPQGAEAVWSSSRANLRLKRNKQLPQPAFTLELGTLGGEILEEAAFTPDGDNSLCSIRPDPAAANGKALRLAPGGAAAVVLNGANLDALKPEFACYAVARIEGDRSNSIFFDHYGLLDGRPWKAKEVFGSDVPSHAYHLFQVSDMPWTNDSPHPKIELHLRAASPAGLKAIWIDRLLILPIATPYAKGKQGHGPELAALGPYAYAPEGDRLWGIEDHKPRCWSLNNFKQPFRVPMLLSDLTHGDDILRSVLGNAKLGLVGARRGDIFLLSAQDGKLQRSEFRPDTAITQVVLHPDGRRAVAATEQGKLWQFSIPELATMELKNAHGQSITSLACSRDGSVLVSGSQDRTVRVWSWRNEQLVERFAFGKLAGSVKAVRISDDKRRLAVLLDSELGVRIWKLDDLNDRFDRLHAKVSELP